MGESLPMDEVFVNPFADESDIISRIDRSKSNSSSGRSTSGSSSNSRSVLRNISSDEYGTAPFTSMDGNQR
jgi:hypothetical protein